MNLLFIQDEAPAAVVEEVAAVEAQATTEVPAEDVAVESQPAAGGGYTFWIMIVAMIAIMYFFMWRPESKRRKQMENFRKGLKKGDKVITAGGIYGVVKEVHDTSLLIEVDSNVTLRIDKNMVVGDPATGVRQ
ncbi:MAG: preprotein translocase subunit YajC [Alistipes sp.]|nr:preprotein translocase subunit YajC [Alistipes sp.]